MVGDINRAACAWELERGRRNWRVPVRGGVVSRDGRLTASLAQQGVGLVYCLRADGAEPMVLEQLRAGTLVCMLERYAPTVPGCFLYIPSVARRSAPLRLFVEAAKELAVRGAS
jgi:DNA-binding transcriptional LysR family regulator